MNIINFQKEQLEKALLEKNSLLKAIKSNKANYDYLKRFVDNMNVDIKANILKDLEKLNGREVDITTYIQESNKIYLYENQKLELKNGIIKIDDYYTIPLIAKEGVCYIRDKKTSRIIYQNKLWMEDVVVQKMFLLGKEEAYKELKNMEDAIQASERLVNQTFEDKSYSIQNLEKWINEGKSYIYPQRYDYWENYTLSRIEDISNPYNGKDIEITLKILDMLDRGESSEKAAKILKEIGVEDVKESVCKAVLDFSKRGVEFYSQSSEVYIDAMKYGSERLKEELLKELEKIKAENQSFEIGQADQIQF